MLPRFYCREIGYIDHIESNEHIYIHTLEDVLIKLAYYLSIPANLWKLHLNIVYVSFDLLLFCSFLNNLGGNDPKCWNDYIDNLIQNLDLLTHFPSHD